MINPPLISKLIATSLLSSTSIILYLLNKSSKPRLYCMIAMLICSLGDVFMTNCFSLPWIVTIGIGACMFICGHLVYAYMYKYLIKESNNKIINKGFILGMFITIIPEVVMIILSLTIASEPTGFIYALFIPIYVFVIGLHICSNLSYCYILKSFRSIILGFGIILFYVTDIWIFLNMYHICNIQDMVWHFYPIAQLLLILFCVPIKKDYKYGKK